MSALRQNTWIEWTALVVLAIGVFAAVQAFGATTAMARRADRLMKDAAALRALEQQHKPALDALSRAADLGGQQPAPLPDLVAQILPDAKPEVREKDPLNVEGSLSLRSVELGFGNMPLPALSRLLNDAATQQPPWQMAECSITPSEREPGMGRVTLVFDTLQKGASR